MSSDEDLPLAQRVKSEPASQNGAGPKRKVDEDGSASADPASSADEAPRRPAKKKAKKRTSDSEESEDKPKRRKSAGKAKKRKHSDDSDSDGAGDSGSESDAPKKKKKQPAKKAARATKVKQEEDSKEDAKPKRAPKGAKVKNEGDAEKKGKGKQKENDSNASDNGEDDEYKWWMDQNALDKTEKWKTLEHNGVFFPPEYVPHGIKMKYKGEEIELGPEQEEVAGFYAQLLGTDWVANPIFRKNFFNDFLAVLQKQKPPPPIKNLEDCDFTPIAEHYAKLRDARKTMTKEEKEAAKKEKKELEEKYGFAVVDGRKEKVGNFRVEPPGLFRGRGAHPKAGCLKQRVRPEQITINIAEGAKVPEPPAGHQWGKVVHDNTVTWLAYWKENINDNFKYVFLAAGSSLKGQSDFKKFEKARELKKHIHRIREDYTKDLKSEIMADRQRATAMYFIDRLALRAGNEKGEDEADTVGCCSLRFEHVTLEKPNKVVFDFLGKDSIRYYNEVPVDDQVFKNIKIFKREPKKEGDPLFDRLDTGKLNKHLQNYMKGLSAKVFRTYNASFTMQEELKKTPSDGTVAEKVLAYNRANREVAILCNHQRTVPKTHNQAIEKIRDKVRALKLQRKQVKEQILELDPKKKKKILELTEEESDLDDEWIAKYEEQQAEAKKKKLEQLNESRAQEGEKPLKELPSPSKKTPTIEKLEAQLQSLDEKIEAQKLAMVDKSEGATVALGTSKINYLDPRITVAWCKKHEVPIEKVFAKTLVTKFKWAIESADNKWVF